MVRIYVQIQSLQEELIFKEKDSVLLLGDFNARVGKVSEIDDVIGMFGEDTQQ